MNDPEQLWPAEAYRQRAAGVGRACALLLLTEAQWIHRRVETIDFVGTELARRRTSVDFTVPPSLRVGLTLLDGQHAVPIATLAKQPLRHFDLRDEGGRAIAVLGREHNGDIASQALIAAAQYGAANAGVGELSPRTIADLRAIATGERAEAEQTVTAMNRAAEEGDEELRSLLEDGWMFFLLSLLTYNYVLLAVVKEVDARRILKFGYDEALEDSRSSSQRLWQGLGAQPLTFSLDAPAAGRAASYHAELVIPEELRIESAVLYDREDLTVLGKPDENADRGALYASQIGPWARPVVFVQLRAERAGLPTVMFAVSIVVVVMLSLGAIVFQPDSKTAGPPVAVLLAASALFAGAVAQRGEHDLVRRFFAPLRGVLVLIAVAALGAAATLAFNGSAHTIDVVWKVAAVTTAVLAAILGYAYCRAVPMTRASDQEQE